MENPSFVSVFPRQGLSRPTSRCPVGAAPCPRTLTGGCRASIPLSCPVPAEGHPRVLGLHGWTLLSDSDLDVSGWALCCPLPTLCQPQELSHTHQPLYCARNHSSSKHWERGTQVAQDPTARVTNPTNHQGQGSSGPAGLEPAWCSGEVLGGLPEMGEGVTLSLEGHRGLGWVQQSWTSSQVGSIQTLCCCKTWAGPPQSPPLLGL